MHRLLPTVLIAAILVAPASQSSAQTPPVADGSMIEWPTFTQALEEAKKNGKIVAIDVFSDTCQWCRKLQTEIYTVKELQTYVFENFQLGRINIDFTDDEITYKGYTLSSSQLGAGFGATGTPTTIFLEPDGDYITRLPGFHGYDEFFEVLRFIGTESFREMSFTEYSKQNESPEQPGGKSSQE